MSQTEILNSQAQAYPGEPQPVWAGCKCRYSLTKQKLHTWDSQKWRDTHDTFVKRNNWEADDTFCFCIQTLKIGQALFYGRYALKCTIHCCRRPRDTAGAAKSWTAGNHQLFQSSFPRPPAISLMGKQDWVMLGELGA